MSKLTKLSDDKFELDIKNIKIVLTGRELLDLRKDISNLTEIKYYDKNYNPSECVEIGRIGDDIEYKKFITK